MEVGIGTWILFNVVIIFLLALDIGVFHKRPHAIGLTEALVWSVIWTLLAVAFNGWIYYAWGSKPGLEFLTGYVIERSLSMDNIFVFVIIFSYFNVPAAYQHRVLFWGIFGALVMRAAFIFAGVALIQKFHSIIYVFGAFLVFTGLRMGYKKEEKIEPERNPLLRLFRRWFDITDRYEGTHFFVKRGSRYLATPLFLVLLLVETTDLIFAVDSIPAILAVTYDPFIVYSSNVLAILGLRALYFALAGVMEKFRYLHYGLAAILVFVGVKMLLTDVYKIPTSIALGIIAVMLGASMVVSVWAPTHPGELAGNDPSRKDRSLSQGP